MKYVLCPPCGSVFEKETEEELVRWTQLHAKDKHGYAPPAEEILRAITTTPPPSGDTRA
jgi:predicted small metal-binding protein